MVADNKPVPRWINGIEPAPEVLALNGVQILERECREQPTRLGELLQAYRNDAALRAQLADFLKLAQGEQPVLFIGMGGSYCSSISGAIYLQSQGRASYAVDAGEWLQYAKPVWATAALSVLVTTSGESAELVEFWKRSGNQPRGLICNNPASTCWNLAQHKLPILAGPEYGNATKTYTNSTAAAIILAAEILGKPWEQQARNALQIVTNSLEPIFARRAEFEQFCQGASNIEIVGRGAAYGGAIMSALCIREMTGYRAAPHTGAGFRHGPNLDVDRTHLAIIFALGRTAAFGIKLAQECNRRGGKVLLISSAEYPQTELLLPVQIEEVAEPWEGITSLLVPQALTLAMVERTGCRLLPRFQYGIMEQ